MGATKIINVLKDDKFEELLEIVKETGASEVIFVMPKRSRAFKSEGQFSALKQEAYKDNKSIAFLCANSEVNKLAEKYDFEILSTKTESSKLKPKLKHQPIATSIAVQNDDIKNDEEDENEKIHNESDENHSTFSKELKDPFDDTSDKPEETAEETLAGKEEEEEYKEEETESEITENDPPYGTELDESGNPVYDEEDLGEGSVQGRISVEKIGEAIVASAKTRGMGDVIKPSSGKSLRVIQKNKKPTKLEIHKEDLADLGWKNEPSQDIWAGIIKPIEARRRTLKSFFFKKKGINFRTKNLPKKGIGILSVISILILTFVIFLTTGSARIEIRPKSQTLKTQLKVTMSPDFSSIDDSFNRIPGQLFTISKSASGEFNATAEKDAVQKSRGTITIYNEYSTSPQPLVATTRFEYIRENKEPGLIFRTLRSVNVPGMKVENGVITPGNISVEVIADKAGQNYNVSAGNFGITAWREKSDAARYEKIYGRSSDSMHGGILGKAKVVSEFDYNNANNQLIEKVNSEIIKTLSEQSVGLELITDIKPQIDSTESTAEIDDAADNLTMTVNGSITTMGFKKEDLWSLVSKHIDKTRNLMIIPEKTELSYKDAIINTANNTLEVIVVIGGLGYAKIDQENTANNLIGKNEDRIKSYLSSVQEIDSAKVILSPFWVKKIPKDKTRLDISLTF